MNRIKVNRATIRVLVALLFVLLLLLLPMVGLFVAPQVGTAPRPVMAQEARPAAAQGALVSEALTQRLMNASAPVSFLIILRDQVDAASFVAEPTIRAASREHRATALYHELTARASQAQAPLRAWLDAEGIAYRAHYLVNMIEVEGDLALATAVQQRPEVDRLAANPLVSNALSVPFGPEVRTWPRTIQQRSTNGLDATAAFPYGLTYTNAPVVWDLGHRGQGIVIASQDTGVAWEHPALQAAYRGSNSTTLTDTLSATNVHATTPLTPTVDHRYNWYDAWGIQGRPTRCAQDAQVPCDDHGHGTHTVGTMLGDRVAEGETLLGMAPDATWIGCRNMRRGTGTPASYTACFEFFLAPFPQGGDPFTDGQPALAPHIINNSWGCPVTEGCDADSLRQVVETMRAAGQMVVASAGNDGPRCSTVRNPISMHDPVFSVGAHNSEGAIAGFSSRGPVTADGSGRQKPEISAPGVSVLSAALDGGTTFLSGTSMASPHVAGAIALLWSAEPTLIGKIDLTEQILLKSATSVPANSCGEGAQPIVPNNTYGYGRLDILAAVELALAPSTLAIAVVDEQAEAIAAQPVTVTDLLTGYQYETTTAFNGIARITPLYAGDYLVTSIGNTLAQTVTLASGAQQQLQLTRGTDSLYFPFILN